MPLKGCKRKSQKAEIKFLTTVGGFRLSDKIMNANITIQLTIKPVNVIVTVPEKQDKQCNNKMCVF
jgi:hypothetical protein